jgi:hypothetical protein
MDFCTHAIERLEGRLEKSIPLSIDQQLRIAQGTSSCVGLVEVKAGEGVVTQDFFLSEPIPSTINSGTPSHDTGAAQN